MFIILALTTSQTFHLAFEIHTFHYYFSPPPSHFLTFWNNWKFFFLFIKFFFYCCSWQCLDNSISLFFVEIEKFTEWCPLYCFTYSRPRFFNITLFHLHRGPSLSYLIYFPSFYHQSQEFFSLYLHFHFTVFSQLYLIRISFTNLFNMIRYFLLSYHTHKHTHPVSY